MSCPTKLTLCCTMLEVAVPSQGIYLKIPYEVDGVITILHVVNKASAVPCRGWLSFSAAAMRANSKHSFSKIRIFRVSSIALATGAFYDLIAKRAGIRQGGGGK